MSYTGLITEENFGPFALVHSTTLSETEKQSTPFADFYDFPINLPTEEQILALMPGNQMAPSLSLSPAEYGKMFAEGYLECENGYCVRPEGYGYSAVDIKMPDVTPEIFQFWQKWYTLIPCHYKIWLPDVHIVQYSDPQKHSAIENLGWGNVSLDMAGYGKPLSYADFGITDPKALDPNFIACIGSCMTIREKESWFQEQPEPYPLMVMLNYLRHYENGIENRVRVWMGIHYVDGKIIPEQVDYPVPMVDRVRGMACHNAWEWSRMATLAPALYQYCKEHHMLGL